VPSLDGLDLARPLHVAVVPVGDRAGRIAPVVIAAIADRAALDASLAGAGGARAVIHDGHAAIGPPAALRAAAPWALTALVRGQVQANLVGTIHGGSLRGETGEELAMVATAFAVQALGETSVPAAERLTAALRQIDRIDGALQIDQHWVELSAALAPAAGSELFAFAALQKASDFAAAARLSPGPWTVLLSGELDWGPFAAVIGEIAADSLFPADLWRALVPRGFMAAAMRKLDGDGELKVMLSGGPADAAALIDRWARATAAAPVVADGARTTAKPLAIRGRGGKLHAVERRPEAGGAAELAGFVGLVDGAVLRAEGPAGAALSWLRAAPRAGLGAALSAAVADARGRRESGLVAIDLVARPGAPHAGEAGPAIALGLGFEPGLIRLRATIPATQLAAAVK
jgi:hypothetical protein